MHLKKLRIATGVMMDVPNDKTHEIFHNFVNIPSDDIHWFKVDLVRGS
jgi:hypothetical protein